MSDENKQQRGPTFFSEELAVEICDTISRTPMSIAGLCRKNPHWPCKDTIFEWRRKYKFFSDLYARAKQEQVEAIVDQMMEIAEGTSEDYYQDENGKKKFDKEHVQRSRLRIDTAKWFACKLAPRIYGDRIKIDSDDDRSAKELERIKKMVQEIKSKHEETQNYG